MSKLLDPISLRDFRRGRIAPSAVLDSLVPENSVQNSLNVNFDEIIGAATVRLGTGDFGSPIIGTLTSIASFTTGDDAAQDIYDANWVGQTFQVTTQGYSNAATVKLTKTGSPTGLVKISIYNTSAGLPTGSALASGYKLGSEISAGTNDITFQLGPVFLIPSTTYALVISLTGGDASNKFGWRYDSAGGYASGQMTTSTNSGSSWSASAGNDCLFNVFAWTSSGTQIPLGFSPFVTNGQAVDGMAAVFYSNTESQPIVYFYTAATDWDIADFRAAMGQNKFRFAQLGSRLFLVNGNTMASSANGFNWAYGASGSVTGNIQYIADLDPYLLVATKNRLLASGIQTALSSGVVPRSRIYFSSIINLAATQFITWNTDETTGDWIDVNPDDGAGDITGFSLTSTFVLVFKDRAMYRLNAVTKTVDTENIFNIGAVSQEAITVCQGVTYFFTGTDIRRTVGDYPEQISRLGVQDFINEIPQSSWTNVNLGHDDWNVYVSIGNVTLNNIGADERTYTNVVLKFSTRDESWSVHSYGQLQRRYIQFTNNDGKLFLELDTRGQAQTVNEINSMADDGTPINYELELQHMEFGNLSHTKQISDKVVIYNQFGLASSLQVKADDGDYQDVDMSLEDYVSVGKNIDIQGNRITFKWFGSIEQSSSDDIIRRPVFEGIHLPTVTDLGIIK